MKTTTGMPTFDSRSSVKRSYSLTTIAARSSSTVVIGLLPKDNRTFSAVMYNKFQARHPGHILQG